MSVEDRKLREHKHFCFRVRHPDGRPEGFIVGPIATNRLFEVERSYGIGHQIVVSWMVSDGETELAVSQDAFEEVRKKYPDEYRDCTFEGLV